MTGKDLILKALKREETPRPAWLPFVGVHGGSLIGVSAEEYLKSSEHIVRGLEYAREAYQPDGLPVLFDLQIEAEVLGCGLQWAKEVPPSVVDHPLAHGTLEDLPAFSVEKGRFPLVKAALQRLSAGMGEDIALYALLTGPFTLLSHLRGSEVFLDMLMDPESVAKTMDFCVKVARETASFYLENGAAVVAIVDPMTTQISPEHFSDFVAPYHNAIFDHVRDAGGFSSLFVCGDATRNLEAMCETRCDNVQVDENIPLVHLRDLAMKHGKSFGGNMRLTTALLLGTEDVAKHDALRCIDTGGNKGFILAPGCDLPYDTPEANLRAVAQIVHDEYQRDVARNTPLEVAQDDFADLELPDYIEPGTVYLDVITLDSAACAPCYYMVDAARQAAEKAGVETVVREHKIRDRSGIGYMCRLNVKNLPTICIDGDARYISIIPDVDSLAQAIRERAEEKKA